MAGKIFECRRCGRCCLGRGGVRLTEPEARAVARHLRLAPAELSRRWLTGTGWPRDIGLGPDGYCRFHQPDGGCRIHPVKPEICRRWPFLPGLWHHQSAWAEARSACPGLAGGLTWADFKAAWPERYRP